MESEINEVNEASPANAESDLERLVMLPLEWTENRQPNRECGYNHCIAETPFGRFLLTWKGWKSEPWQDIGMGFDETPWGDVWYDCWDDVEDAKKDAEAALKTKVLSLFAT